MAPLESATVASEPVGTVIEPSAPTLSAAPDFVATVAPVVVVAVPSAPSLPAASPLPSDDVVPDVAVGVVALLELPPRLLPPRLLLLDDESAIHCA
jgi:hypothetical protein